MRFLLWLAVRLLTRLLVLPVLMTAPRTWRSWSWGSSFGYCAARPAAQVHRRRPGPARRQPCAPRQRWASLLVTPQTRCADPEAADDIDFGIAVWD